MSTLPACSHAHLMLASLQCSGSQVPDSCMLACRAAADVEAYSDSVAEIVAASNLLHELTELTGEDQDGYDVALKFLDAGGDIPLARKLMGLTPLGECPSLCACSGVHA